MLDSAHANMVIINKVYAILPASARSQQTPMDAIQQGQDPNSSSGNEVPSRKNKNKKQLHFHHQQKKTMALCAKAQL
jgi:hypothetical protein